MTPHRHSSTKPDSEYTPESENRRHGSRIDDAEPLDLPWWRLLRRPSEIVALCGLIVLLASAASALGVHYLPATQAVAAEAALRASADTVLHREVLRNSDRIDTLAIQVKDLTDRLTFTNYMQCMAFKSTNSGRMSPRDEAACTKIIQQRLSP